MGGSERKTKAKIRFIRSLPLKEQVVELHRMFFDRTEAATYFRDKCVRKEEEIEALKSDFDTRVKQVRQLWCDQIYNEHSRPGRILKRSMQKY